MTGTSQIFEDVVLAAYQAYEVGDDVNSAINEALRAGEASDQQIESVIARLDTEDYVHGLFEHSAAGNYAIRIVDRLTERGIELAQRLFNERIEFFGAAHSALTIDERRSIEPVAQQLSELLSEPVLQLAEEEEWALRDLSSMIDLILKLNEPDRLLAKRTLALLSRKSGEIVAGGAAWDGLKALAEQVLGMIP